MANIVTPYGQLLGGDLWEDIGEDFGVVALDDTYTYDVTDTMLSHLSGSVGTAPLVGRSIEDTFRKADDIATGISPSLGVTVKHLWVYHDSGTPSTSPLVVYFSQNNDSTDFTRPGDGNPMPIQWPGGVVFQSQAI